MQPPGRNLPEKNATGNSLLRIDSHVRNVATALRRRWQVERVTPCAPIFLNPRRRAEDCPPYQFHRDRRVADAAKKAPARFFAGAFDFLKQLCGYGLVVVVVSCAWAITIDASQTKPLTNIFIILVCIIFLPLF